MKATHALAFIRRDDSNDECPSRPGGWGGGRRKCEKNLDETRRITEDNDVCVNDRKRDGRRWMKRGRRRRRGVIIK